MANNYIAVNQNASVLSSSLMSGINTLALAVGRLQQLKTDMDNMTDGQDWTTVETNFGIPTGKGASVYNLLTGCVSDLTGSNTSNLLNWLGAVR